MAMSPRLSFKGYSLGEALYRNVDAIKGVLAIIGGINVASVFAAGFEWRTVMISLGAAVAALLVKLLGDAVDFYFKEVEVGVSTTTKKK